jgi:hypothetical protein
MFEEGSGDYTAPEHRDDAIAERGRVFPCQHRDASFREREPMLLEVIQRVEHDLDVFGHCVHDKRMVLSFDAGRGEAKDAEIRSESTPLRNRLRANAAMRRRQAHYRRRLAAQPSRTLECHHVGRIGHDFRAPQRR